VPFELTAICSAVVWDLFKIIRFIKQIGITPIWKIGEGCSKIGVENETKIIDGSHG
jgi:hypothetical protein